jgi:hypothetical protein
MRWRRKWISCPSQGRGPFIARARVCESWSSYFTTKVELYYQWGPRLRTSVHSSWRGLPRWSSWFPSTEVEGARDSSWRHHCFTQLYLAAKPSHMGDDVDWLACSLHCPTVCGHQTRGQSFLSDATMSHHITVGNGAFLGGVKPRVWIFDVVLTIWVPVSPNLTWRSSLLLECVYPTSELSWWSCVYPWLSHRVRQRWDGFQLLSMCCQVCVVPMATSHRVRQ